MTSSRKLLAAAITLAAICLIGLLVWRLGGSEEQPAPPAKPTARAAPRAAPPAREQPGAMPPAPSQVTMEDDPVGPLLLEGQVLDSSDDPVEGAEVRLSSNPPRTAKSAADGSFSFDKLLPRTYALNARRGDQVGGPVLHALRAASDPVVIRLAAGASIEVTVVAAEDGAPIAGAAVALQGASLRATTDAAGLARLTGVAAVPLATVEATASGRAPGQVLLQIPDTRGAAIKTRIELRRGAAVSGTVVDQSGAPVAGARVSERDVSQLLQLADADEFAKTDSKGRFTLPAVAAGTYRFHATHPEHAPGSSEPRAVDGIQPVAGVRIELAAGARVAGRVVGKDGAPVPWATVRVGPRMSGGPGLADFGTRQATAGERGEFELEGLPRATVLALAMSEEASSAAVEVDLAAVPDRRDLVLRLDVSGHIEGVVVDSAGQPVPEAQVTAYPDLFGSDLQSFALRGQAVNATDGGGRFVLRGLPDGTYRLLASRSGAASPFSRKATKAATGATGVRLVLEREGRIRGRVQFEDGSSPALFSVAAGLAPPLPVAGRDGTFELTGVAPGTHDVHVRGPDFAPALVRDVVVEPDRARDVGVIKVERGRSVSGRVLGAGGAPVAGATVVLAEQLLGDGKSLSASLMQSFGDQIGFRQTKSDGDGTYAIAGIGNRKDLVIAAEHEVEGRSLAVVVPLGVDSRTVDLQLVGFGSVAGLVTAGGKPAQAQVIATTPAASKQNIVVTSGADGRYQIERLAAGDYKLSATVGGGLGGAFGSQVAHIEAGKQAQVDIDVPLGDITLVVTVKPKRGTIDAAQVFLFSGAVAARTGKEVNEAVLSAGGGGGVKHQLGPASAPFRFTAMKAGAYSVCVIPLTGDLQDPAFAQKLQQHLETLEVHCSPTELPESPLEQSYTATVPPMAPLE